jgi:hypothetical protein
MNKIKKPKWDKPDKSDRTSSSGSYGSGTTIPPDDYIDIGMTAHAKHNSDQIIIKITKVENKYDAEGTITNIIPETKGKPKTELSVGDRVFINRLDVEVLLR